MRCPECGSHNIVQGVADWSARSLEPHDTENTGILIECQCADCSRAFWIGEDARNGFPQPERGACILTAENMQTADDCTMHDHEKP